jgi:hypothetical protein
LVAIPARDEAEGIAATLASVLASIQRARDDGVIRRAYVAVAAHRCDDDTSSRAAAVLSAQTTAAWLVSETAADVPVGLVRTRLVAGAVARWWPLSLDRSWLFNTDADSVVDDRWIGETLRIARRESADAVAGLVRLRSWRASPQARGRYARLLSDGMTESGHLHVYAANLAVRLDTFLAVGGFPAAVHGEEHALVGAIRARDGVVATPQLALVSTSGRVPGRARLGFGHLLASLGEVEDEATG